MFEYLSTLKAIFNVLPRVIIELSMSSFGNFELELDISGAQSELELGLFKLKELELYLVGQAQVDVTFPFQNP